MKYKKKYQAALIVKKEEDNKEFCGVKHLFIILTSSWRGFNIHTIILFKLVVTIVWFLLTTDQQITFTLQLQNITRTAIFIIMIF